MSETHSIVIVGSGPAGYTAAIYAARAGFSPLVVAGSVTAGGALMNTTEVENFPGFIDGIQGPDLMATLQAQAERFGAEVVLDDATALDLSGPIKTVKTGGGRTIKTLSVILATGSAYRELGIEDEKRLSGRGVSWCATCDGFFYRDRPVAVVGGGDSAVEEATFLTKFASKVYLIHRRDSLRASKIMADRALANPTIEMVWNSEVVGLDGDEKLTGVRVRDVTTGALRTLEAYGFFVAIGHEPRSELVRGVVHTDAAGYVQVQGRTTATNIAGVFACGDLVDSRYRQAITAAGSGCAAALDAQHYLDGLDEVFPTKEAPSTTTPVAEQAPVEEPAPVKESAPVEEPAPVKESVSVEEPAPAEDPAPVEEPAPIPRITAPAKPRLRAFNPTILTHPIDVTASSFETEVLHSELPVVVDFWASWCAPCRAMSPLLDELALEYAGKIKVVKVNADAHPTLAADYAVSNLPTIVLIRDGGIVTSVTGSRNKAALDKLFRDLIK